MDIEGFVRARIDDYSYDELADILAVRIREYKNISEENSHEMAKAIAPHGTLIGIDHDDMALEAAAVRLKDAGLDSAPILLKGNFSDLAELLVPHGSGCLVYCVEIAGRSFLKAVLACRGCIGRGQTYTYCNLLCLCREGQEISVFSQILAFSERYREACREEDRREKGRQKACRKEAGGKEAGGEKACREKE